MNTVLRASLWYGQLRGYGRARITALVNSALNRSPEDIRQQQILDFRSHVRRCAQQFPFYATKLREHLGGIPNEQDEFVPSDLPLWSKEDQRAFFSELNALDFRSCYLHSSGGSTGVPVQFYMTRASYEWRLAVARRGYAFAGAEPGRRTFFVWSDAAVQSRPLQRIKSWLHQWVENRYFFNCFFFDRERKQHCCQAINQRQPEALVGYAGKLVELAAFCREHPNQLSWRTPNIVTAAEGLQAGQRALLQQYLGDRIFMSYGSREFMLIGMESPRQCGYHLSDDNLLVEVVDDYGHPVAAGQTGQLAITDLHNAANPFIRYVIGDLGVMSPEHHACPAGLPFRRLLEVQGRNQEFVVTPEGDKLTLIYFAHNLKELPWIEAFQIVQRSQGHLLVRICSNEKLTAHNFRQVEAQLRPKLKNSQIEVQQVEELSRRSNGKIAVLVSELPDAHRYRPSLPSVMRA